ncbi:MAG: YdiY family protein [Phycisphaerales bacterium]
MLREWVVAAVVAGGVCGVSSGARADQIRLATGEVLTVQILETTETSIKFAHPVLGEMTLPRASVEVLAPPDGQPANGAPPTPPTPPTTPTTASPPPSPPPPPPPPPTSFFEGWKGKIEIGLNGSDGNSETLSFRGAVGGKRITDTMETTLDLSYLYSTDDGEKTKSRGEFVGKNDWLFKDSPWGFFVLGKVEFDEFQDWNWRTSAFAGPSYTFIKNERTTLRGRAGLGITKEYGGRRNEIIPEGLIGVDFTHKLTDRQSIFLSAEWLPSLSDWPDYRANAKAGYEIVVDPSTNMLLKLGIEDRYNSNPGEGIKKNDIEYFILLGWEF